jgi:hypothetical protein
MLFILAGYGGRGRRVLGQFFASRERCVFTALLAFVELLLFLLAGHDGEGEEDVCLALSGSR